MKQLNQGCKGEEVGLLQAMLGLRCDGLFGAATRKALQQWQELHGLEADGICGPMTWDAMGYQQTKSARLYVQMIPFVEVDWISISLKDKDKTWPLYRHAREKKADLAINGGLFDMRTYQNVSTMIIGGIINNGGNYSNTGIAFEEGRAYGSTLGSSRGKPVDFIGGAPLLIRDGKKKLDRRGLSEEFYHTATQRMAIGCTDEALALITTGQTHACSLDVVVAEGLHQGLDHLINLDGGGSTSQYVNGQMVFSRYRNIPSSILIKRK